MSGCVLCPRHCMVMRDNGEKGFCQETDHLRVARAALHMWEEPCISGEEGSGTVFFTGCNLRCVYCQRYDYNNQINHKSHLCLHTHADSRCCTDHKKSNSIPFLCLLHIIQLIPLSSILIIQKDISSSRQHHKSNDQTASVVYMKKCCKK